MGRSIMAAGDDRTVHVEWLARRLAAQQEDAAATEQHRTVVRHHRDASRDAYTPGLVAIGPLHAGDAERRRLRPGHRLKMAYLHSLMSRGRPDPAQHLAVVQGYIRAVAAREREARAMYAAEDVDDICAEDFVQMLVLDGCFIIEHLVNNQIPFFVLVDLITHTRLPAFANTGFDPPELLMKLLLDYLGGEKGRDMAEGLPAVGDVSHILHLLHAMVTAARTRGRSRRRASRTRRWRGRRRRRRGGGGGGGGAERRGEPGQEGRGALLPGGGHGERGGAGDGEELPRRDGAEAVGAKPAPYPLFIRWAAVHRSYFDFFTVHPWPLWAVVTVFFTCLSFIADALQIYGSFKK
ncbi:hypothetical protein ACP4OV_006752 [Aristida adscensionis]